MASLERQRLESLYDLEILDTAPEERFDRVCRLAARLFDMPIALFSLVDRERLWFKSRYGLDVASVPREDSFCDSATREGEPLIVEDAHKDPRFANSPLVTGPPHIRFYAGIPVRDALGNALGTFCIIDSGARRLDEEQMDLLKEITGVVQDQILFYRASHRAGEAAQVEAYLRGLIESMDEPVIMTDVRDRVRYHNRAARRYLGVANPVGRAFDEVCSDRIEVRSRHAFRNGVVDGTIYRAA